MPSRARYFKHATTNCIHVSQYPELMCKLAGDESNLGDNYDCHRHCLLLPSHSTMLHLPRNPCSRYLDLPPGGYISITVTSAADRAVTWWAGPDAT